MSIFSGDGRVKIQCRQHFPGTFPIALKRATARAIIKEFKEAGHANHSSLGNTLWVVLEYCNETVTPYRITVDCGFYVERLGEALVPESW